MAGVLIIELKAPATTVVKRAMGPLNAPKKSANGL